MRRVLLLLVLTAACAVPPPRPPAVDPTPPIITGRDAEFTATCARIWLDELGRAIDPSALTSCVDQARHGITGDEIQAWVHNQPEAIAYRNRPKTAPRPTRDQVLDIKANGISMRDEHGRIMLSWFWPSLDRDTQLEWNRRWKADGLTHVWLCPVMQYPGYWAAGGDWRAQPARFAAAVTQLLDDGFIPVIFLTSGDGGSEQDIGTYWAGLLQALAHEEPYLWYVPGFEWIGPGGCCRSKSYADAIGYLHTHAPRAALAAHFQPERATGASYGGSGTREQTPRGYRWHDYQDPAQPGVGAFIEDDDPWQGAEPDFWKRHGGEFLDALLYQTPHGSKLLAGDGWEDRWIEILDRLGAGGRGWRTVGVSFFESTGYDYYHGRAGDDDTRRIAARARALCVERGVSCTFGNGLPR